MTGVALLDTVEIERCVDELGPLALPVYTRAERG